MARKPAGRNLGHQGSASKEAQREVRFLDKCFARHPRQMSGVLRSCATRITSMHVLRVQTRPTVRALTLENTSEESQ